MNEIELDEDGYYLSYAHLCRAGGFLEDHIAETGFDSELAHCLEEINRLIGIMGSRLDDGAEYE